MGVLVVVVKMKDGVTVVSLPHPIQIPDRPNFPRSYFMPGKEWAAPPIINIPYLSKHISRYLCLDEPLNDSIGILLCGRLSTKISSDRLALSNGLFERGRSVRRPQSTRSQPRQRTASAAASILLAYSFRFMCLSYALSHVRSNIGRTWHT